MKAKIAAAILAIFSALLIAAAWCRNRPVELPKPSGPFPVARILHRLSDGMPLWIWYPAKEGATGPRAPYLPQPIATGLFRQNLAAVHSHALDGGPISRTQGLYPLIVFMPETGAYSAMYTAVLEELTSYGFIVAGITQSGGADLIRRVVDRAEEIYIKVGIGPFTFRFGVLGHGDGGAAAAEACATDERIHAGLNLDGRPSGAAMTQPFLTLWSEASFFDRGEDADLHNRALSRSREPFLLRVRGLRHDNVMDWAMLFDPIRRRSSRIGAIGGERGLLLTRYYVRRFFNAILAGKGPEITRGPTPEWPEVFNAHQ